MATRGDIIDPILAEEDAKLSAFVLATVGMISLVNEYATENSRLLLQHLLLIIPDDAKVTVIKFVFTKKC